MNNEININIKEVKKNWPRARFNEVEALRIQHYKYRITNAKCIERSRKPWDFDNPENKYKWLMRIIYYKLIRTGRKKYERDIFCIFLAMILNVTKPPKKRTRIQLSNLDT